MPGECSGPSSKYYGSSKSNPQQKRGFTTDETAGCETAGRGDVRTTVRTKKGQAVSGPLRLAESTWASVSLGLLICKIGIYLLSPSHGTR